MQWQVNTRSRAMGLSKLHNTTGLHDDTKTEKTRLPDGMAGDRLVLQRRSAVVPIRRLQYEVVHGTMTFPFYHHGKLEASADSWLVVFFHS